MTFLNEVKMTPFFVHYIFSKNYNIVLTEGIMKNMAAEKKKLEVRQKKNEKRIEPSMTAKNLSN